MGWNIFKALVIFNINSFIRKLVQELHRNKIV